MKIAVKAMKLWLAIGLFFAANTLTAQEVATVNNNNNYPVFALQSLEGKEVSSADYRKNGKYTIIMYFSPTCSHCRAQTEQITSNMKLFGKANWLFVSAYSIPEIRQFITDMGLAPFKSISLVHDPSFGLGGFFDLDQIPGIFVYGPDGNLKKQFRKNQPADKIAEVLK